MPQGELLLEVRCEEIPARLLQPAVRELATRVFEELMGRDLAPQGMRTGFTPRRLVLAVEGLAERQPDRLERVVGPPTSAAFDADGAPTAAALGFARRCGVEAGALLRVDTGRGEYVAADVARAGRPTREILAEVLPSVLASLAWDKPMTWGDGSGPWVRPVHGVVALFADEVVPFALFGVAAGATTCGHPVLSPKPFAVSAWSDYRTKLARRGIQVGFEARREALARRLNEGAVALGGELVPDPELLDRLTAICEIPGVVAGRFDERYLELPREVLSTSLRDHQSAFTAQAGGRLLPVFLTVMDRPDDPAGRVQAGNEWVVEARLADARFFYEEDRKRPLADRVARLDQLTFHAELGSLADKSERVQRLAAVLAEALGWAAEAPDAVEAARLAKCDLTTELVKEFTSLQGTMGGVYAREEGLPEALWQAIYDQYRPAGADDPIPRGRAGRLLGLADRLDSLVGMFGLGLLPSGSRDPFGLRRAAQGVVRIVLEAELPLDLDLAVAQAVVLYGGRLRRSGEEILASLRPFLHDRVRAFLGRAGLAYDEIEAALAVGGAQLPDVEARARALHAVRSEPGFLAVVLAAKRIANILRDQAEHELDPERLIEGAERELYRASLELRDRVLAAEARGEYEACLRSIVAFADVLERFFVEVLVMDENRELRHNRLALLQSIQRVLSRTARLTEMVVDRDELRQGAAGA